MSLGIEKQTKMLTITRNTYIIKKPHVAIVIFLCVVVLTHWAIERRYRHLAFTYSLAMTLRNLGCEA